MRDNIGFEGDWYIQAYISGEFEQYTMRTIFESTTSANNDSIYLMYLFWVHILLSSVSQKQIRLGVKATETVIFYEMTLTPSIILHQTFHRYMFLFANMKVYDFS